MLLDPQRQSGASLSGLFRNTWIFNPTVGGALFTSLTQLTCYQLALSVRRCVRLQCWAQKRPFPRLRALINVAVGQPFLLNFLPFVEDIRSVTSILVLLSALTPILCNLNPMYNLTCYSVPFILSRTLQLCRIGSLHLPATL